MQDWLNIKNQRRKIIIFSINAEKQLIKVDIYSWKNRLESLRLVWKLVINSLHLIKNLMIGGGSLDTQRDTGDVGKQRKGPEEIHQESNHLKAKDRGPRRNQACWHPGDLWFLPLNPIRNKFMLFKSPSLLYFVWKP